MIRNILLPSERILFDTLILYYFDAQKERERERVRKKRTLDPVVPKSMLVVSHRCKQIGHLHQIQPEPRIRERTRLLLWIFSYSKVLQTQAQIMLQVVTQHKKSTFREGTKIERVENKD